MRLRMKFIKGFILVPTLLERSNCVPKENRIRRRKQGNRDKSEETKENPARSKRFSYLTVSCTAEDAEMEAKV